MHCIGFPTGGREDIMAAALQLLVRKMILLLAVAILCRWEAPALAGRTVAEQMLSELGVTPTVEDVARCLRCFDPDADQLAEIRKHLADLGSDSFSVRNDAQRALLTHPVLPTAILEEAAGNQDAEVRFRARTIRRKRGAVHRQLVLEAALLVIVDRNLRGLAPEIIIALGADVADVTWRLAGARRWR